MLRIRGWEKRLKVVIEKHLLLPSQYGVSDCYMIPDDIVEALTGERIFPDIEYTTPIGAAKALLEHGFETVEQAFASKFDEIPPSLAQRGDIGVIDDNGVICGGAFTSFGFMTRNDSVPVFLPISQVKTAFKVAR